MWARLQKWSAQAHSDRPKQSACLERFLGAVHSHRAWDPALWGSEPTGDCRSPGNVLSPVETMRGSSGQDAGQLWMQGRGWGFFRKMTDGISRGKRLHCEPKMLVGTSTQDTTHLHWGYVCVFWDKWCHASPGVLHTSWSVTAHRYLPPSSGVSEDPNTTWSLSIDTLGLESPNLYLAEYESENQSTSRKGLIIKNY